MGTFTDVRYAAGTVYATWNGATDAYGVSHYYAELWKEGTSYRSPVRTETNSIEFAGVEDNSIYEVRVTAYDYAGNASGTKVSDAIIVGDITPPTAPAYVGIEPVGWTNNVMPVLSWSGIQDVNLLKAQYKTNNSQVWIDIPAAKGTHAGSAEIDLSALAEGVHTIYVRGVDESGRAGEAGSVLYYKATTPPNAMISIADETADTAVLLGSVTSEVPLISWKLVYGYGTEQPLESLVTIFEQEVSNQTSATVYYEWDTTMLPRNKLYSVYLIAEDTAGNIGVSQQVVFTRTQTGAEIAFALRITSPEGKIVGKVTPIVFRYVAEECADDPVFDAKLIVNGKEVASNTGAGNTLDFDAAEVLSGSTPEKPLWKYPEGQVSFFHVQGKDGDGGDVYSSNLYDTTVVDAHFADGIDTEIFDQTGTVEIFGGGIDGSSQGSIVSKNRTLAGNIQFVEVFAKQNYEGSTGDFVYQYSLDDGQTWSIIPLSGETTGIAERYGKIELPLGQTGTSIRIKVILTGGGGVLQNLQVVVRYTAYTTAVLVDNQFGENARGFTGMNGTWHMAVQGSIVLADTTSGSLDSTLRKVSADVEEAVLVVEEIKPEGTEITYQISTDGGATFEDIMPGDYNTPEDWKALLHKGKEVVLRANLHSNTMGLSPELKSWTLGVSVNTVGQPHVVQLVEEPTNLSALANANYGTLLRWKPTEESQGNNAAEVTYNIYRSETPYFQPSEETLLAKGIKEPNYTDMNLNFGRIFYYQVTAVKMIDGYPRESLPSNQAWSQVVEYGEAQKRLGLQDYRLIWR